MSKEKNKSVSADLEYKYSEDELGKEESVGLDQASQMKANLKAVFLDRFPKKKIFLIVSMLIASLAIYKFLMAENAPKPPVEKTLAAELAKPKVATVVEHKEVLTPVSVKVPRSVPDDYGPKIAELQFSIGKMEQSIKDVNSALSILTTSMTALTQKISKIEAMDIAKTEKVMLKKTPVHNKHAAVKAVYYLKAVVPGRAWLKPNTGHLMTVKVGDPLAGYGVIKSIDIDAGKVYTGSGRVIEYGKNDS